MAFDPTTDIDEGGDQVNADATQQDYQDQLERQQAGIGVPAPSFRPTSPGVYSPTPAPAPSPAPQPQGITPPVSRRPPPPGDYDVVRSVSFTPQQAPASGSSLTWKDYGDQVWRGVLGSTASVAGAVDFVQNQIENNPDLKTYAGSVRDWATKHAEDTLDDMSPRAKEVLSASLLGYVPGSLSRDAQGNQIPTPGSVGWSAYLAMHLTEMIPDGLAMLVPGKILGTAAVKTAELFGVATKAIKAGETAATLTKAGETAVTAGNVAGTAGYFGTEGAGQFYNEIHKEIGDASDADLKAGSAFYASRRAAGVSEGQAKYELTQRAAPFVYGAAVAGAAGGAAMGLGKGILRGAITGAAAMGAQGGVTSTLQQTAEQQAGTRQGYDLGSIIADTVSSGVQGAVLGGVGGAFHRGGAAPETQPPAPKPGVGEAETAALRDQLTGPEPPKLLTYEGGGQQALPSPTDTSINVPAGRGQIVPPSPVRFGDVNIAPVTRGPEPPPTAPEPTPAPTTEQAPPTQTTPPATQAAIDTSRGAAPTTAAPSAEGAAGTVPRPSEGMNRKQLSEALTGQVDPKALKAMSAKDMATRFDALNAQQEPTTVVKGSETAPPSSEPKPAPEAGGAAPPSSSAGVGPLPVATEAAGTKVPEPVVGEVLPPEKPKTAAAIRASRRATAKGQLAEPGPPVRGDVAEASMVHPGQLEAPEGEPTRVEQARADRASDLAEAVRAIPAPRGSALEAVLRKAQRYLSESIAKTDGSKDAMAELIHNWMEKEPTAPYPGTKITARMLGEHLMQRVAGQLPVEREEARAEIAEARREDIAREGAESKTVTGESIEQAAETRSEGAEGTSAVTPVVKKADELPDTTDHRRTADNLIQKVLNREMTPQEADLRYGKPQPGPGAKRRWPRLADRLRDWIAHAEDPKVERQILEDLASTQNNAGLTAHQKSVQTKKLTAALERTGPEFASELREHLAGMEDPVGKAADDQAREAQRAAARADVDARTAARTQGTPLTQRASPSGISPTSSRYVRMYRDSRLNDFVKRALASSEHYGVPYTLHDALRSIVNHSGVRAELKPLWQMARSLLTRTRDIPVMSGERALEQGYLQRPVEGAYGYYMPRVQGREHIGLGDSPHPVETILHEALHSLMHDRFEYLMDHDPEHPDIQAMGAILGELSRQFQEAGEIDPRLEDILHAATESVHEAHSWLMTNPLLQEFAASRAASPEFVARMRELGFPPQERGRSVWRYFTDMVRRALGLNAPASASEYTLLDHLARPLADITERGSQYNERLLPQDPVLRQRAEPLYQAASSSLSQRARDLADRVDVRGVGDRFRRALLSAATSDGIVARYARMLPGLENWRAAYEGIARSSKEFSDKYADKVNDLTRRYNQLDDKQTLGHLMTDTTLGEAHLGEGLRADANKHLTTADQQAALRDLQQRYSKLSPEAKQLYGEYRDVYDAWYKQKRSAELGALVRGFMPDVTDEQHAEFAKAAATKAGLAKFLNDPNNSDVAKSFGDNWAKNRQLALGVARVHNQGFVQGDYFPLRRFGNYVVRYGSAADPEHYGVEMFESRAKAEARRAELVRQGVEMVHQVASKRDSDLRDLVPHHPAVEELTNALTRGGYSEAEAAHVRDTLNSILLQHATHSAASRARMTRRNVRGAATDHSRVLASEFLSNTVAMGHLDHGLERAKALSAMREQVNALEHPNAPAGAAITAESVLREAEKRSMPVDTDNVLSTLGAKVNSFSYAQSLMSVSHMLTSSMEAHTNSTALLGARHGVGRATLALTRALTQASPVLKVGVANTIAAVRGELKASDWNLSHLIRDRMIAKGANKLGLTKLFTALENAGLIDHTVLQDMRMQANPTGKIRTIYGTAWNRFQNFNAASAHAVDVMNKSAIAKAAFDLELARTKGDVDAAVKYAVETTRKAMPNYNLGNKPRVATARGILGPLGAPLFQFKNYGLHMYTVMANLARESMSGPERWEARKAFAGLLASHAMMAGVITLIADPLRYIGGGYDLVTGAAKPHNYENDVRGYLASTFGPEVGELLSRGLPHALGIDVHRRVGLANLLEIPEMSSFDKSGAGQVLLGLMTGATGENLQNVFDGVMKLIHGDVMGGIVSAAPRPVRDVMKGMNLAEKGVTDSKGKTILAPDKLSTWNVASQMAGFQPAPVSEFREGRNAAEEAYEESQTERTRLKQRWADPDTRDDARQEIALYNQDPRRIGSRITIEELLKDQAQRRKQQATGPFGLKIPRQSARQAAQAGSFANIQ